MGACKYLANVTTLRNVSRLRQCALEVCPQGVFEMRDKRAAVTDKDLCMECGACAKNCDFDALSVNAGVGRAAAIITGPQRTHVRMSPYFRGAAADRAGMFIKS